VEAELDTQELVEGKGTSGVAFESTSDHRRGCSSAMTYKSVGGARQIPLYTYCCLSDSEMLKAATPISSIHFLFSKETQMNKFINWILSLFTSLFGKKTVTEEIVVEMKTVQMPSTADARRKRNKRQRVARRDNRRAVRGLPPMGR